MNDAKIQRLIILENERRRLKEQLDEVETERKALQEELSEEFIEEGRNSINQGGYCLYLKQELWASTNVEGVDPDRIRQAFSSAGMDWLVESKVNTHKLSAFVRELRAAGEELPEQAKEVVKVSEGFKLAIRKSS